MNVFEWIRERSAAHLERAAERRDSSRGLELNPSLVERAFAQFEASHPEWTASLFDRHFLCQRGMPILRDEWPNFTEISAAKLARAWGEQWDFGGQLRLQATRRALPAARKFLALLLSELGEGVHRRGAANVETRKRPGRAVRSARLAAQLPVGPGAAREDGNARAA